MADNAVINALSSALHEPVFENSGVSRTKEDYGSWSPNSVRTILVAPEFVLVEFFKGSDIAKKIHGTISMVRVKQGRVAVNAGAQSVQAVQQTGQSRSSRDPLAAFLSKRSYHNVEEIIICVDRSTGAPIFDAQQVAEAQLRWSEDSGTAGTSKYADGASISKMADVSRSVGYGVARGSAGNVRLRCVSIAAVDPQAGVVLVNAINGFRNSAGVGQGTDAGVAQAAPTAGAGYSDELSDVLPSLCQGLYSAYDKVECSATPEDYLRRYSLVPGTYMADDSKGELAGYFKDMDNGTYSRTDDSDKGDSTGEPEGRPGYSDADFADILRSASAGYKSLKTAENLSDGDKKNVSVAFQLILSRRKGADVPDGMDYAGSTEQSRVSDGSPVYAMDSVEKINALSVLLDSMGLSVETGGVSPDDTESLVGYYKSVLSSLKRFMADGGSPDEDEGGVEGYSDELFRPSLETLYPAIKESERFYAFFSKDADEGSGAKASEYDDLHSLLGTVLSIKTGCAVPEGWGIGNDVVAQGIDDGQDAFAMDSKSKLSAVMQKAQGLELSVAVAPPMEGHTVEDFVSYYSSLTEAVKGKYPELFDGSSPEDVKKRRDDKRFEDRVISIFGSSINARVTEVLGEYTKMFSSGYEMDYPYGVLGNGTTVYKSKQGGTIGVVGIDKMQNIILRLWDSTSGTVGIDPSKIMVGADIDEIVAADDSVYLPEVMARVAYGYTLRSRGKKSDCKNWSSYSKQELRPFLEQVLLRSVCTALDGIRNDQNALIHSSDKVNLALTKAQNKLYKCLLVNDFVVSGEGLQSKFVSLQVRVLTNEIQDGGAIRQVAGRVFSAIAMDVSGNMDENGDNSSRYSGHFGEVTIVADRKQANAVPLFAYSVLKKMKESGKPFQPGINNVLLGKDMEGRILRAGNDIDFHKHFAHYILAASRAGKGVMTLNFLAGSMDGVTPLAYADNKPDMLSLLRSINPNVFGVNGSSMISDPENGTDIFSQVGPMRSEVDMANIPEWLQGTTVSDLNYESLGNIFYIRFLMLVMGIIIGRVDVPSLVPQLGGDQGWNIVMDEFAATTRGFSSLVSSWETSLAPRKAVSSLIKSMKDGKSVEEVLEGAPECKPGLFWNTTFLECLTETARVLADRNDAGFKNKEEKCNNIFILGQHYVETGNVNYNVAARPQNFGSRTEWNGKMAGDILGAITRIGDADAFLGRSEGGDNFLMANDGNVQEGTTSRTAAAFLNSSVRGFAYVSSITGRNANLYHDPTTGKGTTVEKIAFAEKQCYFKPFLLLEESDINSYSVSTVINNVRSAAGQAAADDFIRDNCVNGDMSVINPGVGFTGFLEQVGISREAIYNQLQKGADVGNWVVHDVMGYPGTWKDFVYDLRPEWLFSAKDIADALKNYAKNGAEYTHRWVRGDRIRSHDTLCDMEQLYPDLIHTEESVGSLVGGSNGGGGLLESDFGEEQEGAGIGVPGAVAAGVGIGAGQASAMAKGQEGIRNGVYVGVGDSGISEEEEEVLGGYGDPLGDMSNDTSIPRFYADAAPTTVIDTDAVNSMVDSAAAHQGGNAAVDETLVVTTFIMQKLGSYASGGRRVLEANMQRLRINGVDAVIADVASPQNKVNWSQLLRGGYLTELKTTSNYINNILAPAMGWGECTSDSFFSECQSLQVITVDGKQYSRLGQATGSESSRGAWYDPRNTCKASGLKEWLTGKLAGSSDTSNMGNSSTYAERERATDDLISAGINRGKESFKNGGAVRTAAATALGIGGASLVTGGASTALLCSLACWPPAWGLVAIGAAVRLYTSGKRRRARQ